jgi:hypothetical protein
MAEIKSKLKELVTSTIKFTPFQNINENGVTPSVTVD